jgi:hypothetical protein
VVVVVVVVVLSPKKKAAMDVEEDLPAGRCKIVMV